VNKLCNTCNKILPLNVFQKNHRYKGGHINICNSCKKEVKRLYYQKNKELIKEKNKKWEQENRERRLQYQKEWFQKNKKRSNEVQKKYRREKQTAEAKITQRLRNRVYQALKNQSAKKITKTMSLIGCDIDCLKIHIEKQFTNGMTWDNHGLHGWHIDHIKPCASYDLAHPEQQKKCFHYTNLQPLWAEDNLRKSDKLNWVNL